MNIFLPRASVSYPWIQFAMPIIYKSDEKNQYASKSLEFGRNAAIALELKVLLNSPQANWSQLLKILLMRNAHLSSIIFSHLIKHLPTNDCYKAALTQPFINQEKNFEKCNGFLCGKECNSVAEWICSDDGNFSSLNIQIPRIDKKKKNFLLTCF